jgi:serine/threonine protein phosphatase PrpC
MSARGSFVLLDWVHTAGTSSRGPDSPTDNEDAFVVTPEVAAVIDGASPLGTPTSGRSGAAVLAETLACAVGDLAAETFPRPADWLSGIIAAARATVEPTASFAGAREASAAGCLVRLRAGGHLDYALFGDCLLATADEATPLTIKRDPRLGSLDAISLAELRGQLDRGRPSTEAREAITPVLTRHRNLLNTPHGYPALTLDGAGAGLASYGTLTLVPGQRLLLASDGFTESVELFGFVTWSQLLDGQAPLLEVEARLRDVQGSDAGLRQHPRFKVGDDATAVLVEWQPVA